ncbi:uncharacterized protein [Nicotiana tomentosiformis]|uniref:uncharacterized protein n=1 Tax=Nicotiana tomentosiformis TaxID=4098 RepID=UPI00051AC494|nr:uncharacterized protein LOC104103226 [Nicotiana tomentosiformis]
MAIEEDDSVSAAQGATTPAPNLHDVDLVHHNHPLYIHPSDMQGFVLGTCRRKMYDHSLHELWDRCNGIVLACIMNTVSPNLFSTVIFASNAHKVWEDLKKRLRELWDEYEALAPSRSCGCPECRRHAEHYQTQKLYQLLTGLNESFKYAKDQVFMTRPLPNIHHVYAMIINVESQRNNDVGITIGIGAEVTDPTTLLSNKTSAGGYRQKNNFEKALVQCDYCNYKGHTQENCFKLHGYPAGFKPKKKGGPPNTYSNTYANNVTSAGGQYSGGQHCSQPGVPSPAQFFTPEQ